MGWVDTGTGTGDDGGNDDDGDGGDDKWDGGDGDDDLRKREVWWKGMSVDMIIIMIAMITLHLHLLSPSSLCLGRQARRCHCPASGWGVCS